MINSHPNRPDHPKHPDHPNHPDHPGHPDHPDPSNISPYASLPHQLAKICEVIDSNSLHYWLIQELTKAYLEARQGKRHTLNEHAFELRWLENIIYLAEIIETRLYEPGGSISFIVYDPKIREIFAAPFIDRVVHHLLHKLQNDWWESQFIDDSYSCRVGLGTWCGIQRIHDMMEQASNGFTKSAYIIKLDFKNYFMSLPRQKLYEVVHAGLLDQFSPYFKTIPHSHAIFEVYRLCDFLWKQILLDDPVPKSRQRPPLSNWDDVPFGKSLQDQPPGHGIVIGNQTSQLVSNIYLNQLDHYIKDTLGYQYYGRYVDDFFIIVPESQYQQAKKDVKLIENYTINRLGLTIHPTKRYCQSVYKGVAFLGVRIYPHCYYPSDRLQRKLDHILYQISHHQPVNDDTIISYLGMFQNLNADKFVKKLFFKHDLDYSIYQEMTKEADERRKWTTLIKELKQSAKDRNK